MSLQAQIEEVLTAEFHPHFLLVENESHRHSSGKGGDSHFKVTIVGDCFQNQSLVNRHRAVQKTLKPLTSNVHALGLHTYTATEWQARAEEIPDSPACGGGSK